MKISKKPEFLGDGKKRWEDEAEVTSTFDVELDIVARNYYAGERLAFVMNEARDLLETILKALGDEHGDLVEHDWFERVDRLLK